MNIEKLKNIVEGFLFASDKPLTVEKIVKLFPEGEEPKKEEVAECINTLIADFESHGIELKEVKSGFRFQVRQDNAPWVSKLWDERPAKYTRAMLETLALIVYRQPITRGEIEEIRGVAVSSHIIRTMMDRDWIKIIGHRDVPGRPALFASTKIFLDYFNLTSLEDLPPLSEIKDLDAIATELDPEQNSALISAIRDMQKESASEGEANAENVDIAEGEDKKTDKSETAALDSAIEETLLKDSQDESAAEEIEEAEEIQLESGIETEAHSEQEELVEELIEEQSESHTISELEDDLEIQISVASHDVEDIEDEEHQIEETQKSFSDLLSSFGNSSASKNEPDDDSASDDQKNSVESDTQ